jgi:uncharacterized protein (DUF433 family)
MSTMRVRSHPYVVQERGASGIRPVIRGTHTPVRIIVGYYKLGYSVDDILNGLPHLTPAQVYDALSYYHDHQQEIEQDLAASQDISALLRKYDLTMDDQGRIGRDGQR